jgi:hypothetical protein
MKKIYVLSLVVFHMIGFQSCTPETLDETTKIQACCGDDIPIPPPLPPPPPGDEVGN